MPSKNFAVNRVRAWFARHLLKTAMWLTDAIECHAIGSNFVTCEARHHRTNALIAAPDEIELKHGDVFLYIGSW